MGDFKKHLITGSVASCAVMGVMYLTTKKPDVSILFSVATLAGSLSPDIDTGSIPSRIFAIIGIVLSGFLIYTGEPKSAAIVGMVYMGFSSDKHRGITHSWLLVVLCAAIGAVAVLNKIPVYYVLLAPFAFGVTIHKFFDR